MIPRRATSAVGALVVWMTAACAAPESASGPACTELVTKWPGSLYLGDYDAPEVTSMADLPERVQAELAAHLRARLGDAVFSELVLTGGQAIDHDVLLNAEPSAADWQWRVPAYRLNFRLTRPDACLEAYYADISLDEEGRVLEEIDLPNVAAQGGRLQLVSLERARAAVRALGHGGELPVEISYRPDLDSLVWVISPSDASSKDGVIIHFVEVVVDARDGRVVESVEREAIE